MAGRSPRGGTSGSRATIRDVATAAGVGIATASRALSGHARVSEQVRTRVETAARKLAYRPNRHARMLRGLRGRAIGVMVPILAPLYTDWLRGAGEVARRYGYVLLVCDGQNSMRLMEAQLERLFQEGVDGLLLAGSTPAPRQIERFIAAGIPIGPDVSSRSRIRDTGEAVHPAARAAFRALVAEGHRRIAYLMRVERDEGYASRLQRARVGWLEESLREVDATLDGSLVIPVGRAEVSDQCEAAVLALLHRPGPPTAVVAGVSLLTIPLLRALRAAGRRVPEDVSVLGFDESGWEEIHEPPISVVRHDYFAVAAATTEELIARIEGRAPPGPDPLEYHDQFVRRGSIGPAPPR